MKGFSEIFWHDCVIESVLEIPSKDVLTLNVDYPIDWEKNIYEPRSIHFEDCFSYEVDEMPFEGNPTILKAIVLLEVGSPYQAGGYFKVQLKTNAGNRYITAKKISLGGKQNGI